MEHHEWNDIVAMKGAREILAGVAYPSAITRRSLYASWLRVFASNEWHDTFDGLMLDCVAATPSVSTPGMPLFASFYKAYDRVIDRHYANVLTPILRHNKIPPLFTRSLEAIEPLPTRPGFVDYLADLIRKSCTSQEALNEAGLAISLCSLALAVVVAKPVKHVQDFLLISMKNVLPTAAQKYFDSDDLFWPSGMFLCQLAYKADSLSGVVKPYLVLLVLGQYAYYVKSGDAAPRDDVTFLEQGFLNQAKFGYLEIVELQCFLQEKTGLSAASVNKILRKNGSSESMVESGFRVAEYLRGAGKPMQKTRPWCRTVDTCLFSNLNLCDNLDYGMRLTALLAPDINDELWDRPEFADVSASRIEDARLWAADWEQRLGTRKHTQNSRRQL